MVADLFKNALSMSAEERKQKFSEIRNAYKNILNDADEKVTIANTMYDIVERYQRKLEGEVQKFKLELEADSPGVTAILEQKVRESEQAARQLKKEQQRRKRKLLEARMGRVTYISDRTPSADSPSVAEQIQQGIPSGGIFQKPLGVPVRPVPATSSMTQGRRIQSYPSRLSDIKAMNAAGNALYPVSGGAMGGAGPTNPMLRPSGRPGQPGGLLINAFSSIPNEPSRHGRPRNFTVDRKPHLHGRLWESSRRGVHRLPGAKSRRVTNKVQEILKESMQSRERNRMDSLTAGGGGSGEDEVDVGNEDEGQGEEGDQRKWCICNKVRIILT